MTRPIHASIDTQALRHNYRVAKRLAPSACVWAVLKADAYGHGLPMAARALMQDADGFIVAEVSEAVSLRNLGIQAPVLLIEGWFAEEDLLAAIDLRLAAVIHCAEQISLLERLAPARVTGAGIPVFLKINTGMNRLGFSTDEVAAVLARLRSHPAIAEIALMTHFAQADVFAPADEPCPTMRQLARFDELCSRLAWTGACSLANSAALLRFTQTHRQHVRPGVMLYGASPFPEQKTAAALALQPVMTLCSELIAVRHLHAGERVSYGGTFVADRPMRIGVVACGYADGYPRHAPTGTPVLVDGQRTRLLGRVTMDMLMVELSPCPDARIGSPVVLWGRGLPADEIAAAAGTISYELFTARAPRVPLREM